jgi:hypothetical protein
MKSFKISLLKLSAVCLFVASIFSLGYAGANHQEVAGAIQLSEKNPTACVGSKSQHSAPDKPKDHDQKLKPIHIPPPEFNGPGCGNHGACVTR